MVTINELSSKIPPKVTPKVTPKITDILNELVETSIIKREGKGPAKVYDIK